MSHFFLPRLLAAAALLTTVSLTACNTGDGTGATNVESGDNKSNDPTALQPATSGDDSATSGLRPDTSRTPSTRQVYEEAADRIDRNNDGIAD
ncbi:MAG: hypothetical protein H7Z21_16990 [Hymenobacter sp.]|nr:hypothetical protein [Hymenobacter sp.]